MTSTADKEANLNDLQYMFAAHLRDPLANPPPADIEDRRMQIYRDLFFNNVKNFLANSFPVLSETFGTDRWALLIRDFYRDHQSHSPLFPDLPKEFLDYLANERSTSQRSDPQPDPPFLYELAHYEWVETGLALAEEPEARTDVDEDGDLLAAIPQTYGLAWLFSYSFPVNEIGKENQPTEPGDSPLHFLVYRNADDKVKFIKLNIVSARLFELLSGKDRLTGREALLTIAEELNHPDREKVIAMGLAIMSEWRSKGILIGTVGPN